MLVLVKILSQSCSKRIANQWTVIGVLSQVYGITHYTTKLLNKMILASYVLESSMHAAIIFLTILVNIIQFF